MRNRTIFRAAGSKYDPTVQQQLRDLGFSPGREVGSQATLMGKTLWCRPAFFPHYPTFAVICPDGGATWGHISESLDDLRTSIRVSRRFSAKAR